MSPQPLTFAITPTSGYTMNQPVNGWLEYQKLVLDALDRHERDLQRMNDKIDAIRINDIPHISADITALKVKSGMWGALAGTVFATLVSAFTKFFLSTPG